MRIRICMKNRLLADGLKALVKEINPQWPVVVNNDPFPVLEKTDLFLTDGHICCRRWRTCCPDAKFVLIDTGRTEQEVTFILLAEHYDGVFDPAFDSSLFNRALRAVCDGQMWLEQKHLKGLVYDRQSRKDVRLATLSNHEMKIAALVSQGLRNRQIADQLCVCEQTIKGTLTRIYQKLGINNRTQLARLVTSHPAPNDTSVP